MMPERFHYDGGRLKACVDISYFHLTRSCEMQVTAKAWISIVSNLDFSSYFDGAMLLLAQECHF
jgi:hypothetical protein